MKKEDREQVEKMFNETGDRSRTLVLMEMTHDGGLSFSYSGNTADLILMRHHMRDLIAGAQARETERMKSK